jgi:hypothetical protein
MFAVSIDADRRLGSRYNVIASGAKQSTLVHHRNRGVKLLVFLRKTGKKWLTILIQNHCLFLQLQSLLSGSW